MNRKWSVEFYQTENGECPVEDFLDTLPTKDEAKVMRTIALLREFGTSLREPHCSYLEEGIFELRTKISSNIHRILYFHYEDGKFILLNGFTKKTQKTPPKEKGRAKKYKTDFLER